jgi:uncharacterized phage protein (TIGR02220 family)
VATRIGVIYLNYLGMAEDKKSFLLYADLIHTVKKLKKEDAGELLIHILEYVNDLNPTTENYIVEITFEPIKQQLKRDLVKYESKIVGQSNAGKLGNLRRWNKDLYDKVISRKVTLDEALNIAKHRKTSQPDSTQSHPIANIAVNDNDNDNDSVNVNDNTLTSIGSDFLLNHINKTFNKEFKPLTRQERENFNQRLRESYIFEDFIRTIDNLKNDDFHKSKSYTFCTPEYIARLETIQKFHKSNKLPPTKYVIQA